LKKRNRDKEPAPTPPPAAEAAAAGPDPGPVFDDLELVESSLHSSLKLRGYFENPRVPFADKVKTLKRIFKDYISPAAYDFLFLLVRSGALHLLTDMLRSYRLRKEETGILDLEVRTALPLTPEENEDLNRRLTARFKRPLLVRNVVDESIIGGMVVKTGDLMIDASLRTKMTAMIKQLRKG
jgi:F-type H+-transporting ATPase subunit delta